MNLQQCLIKTTGEVIPLEGKLSMEQIEKLIGAAWLDFVTLTRKDPIWLMAVDDLGWETETVQHEGGIELRPTRARKPVNEKATLLYQSVCAPGTTHQIVGDVVIMQDSGD